jgi:hypothetical protein
VIANLFGSLVASADRSSLIRHFVYTFVAVFALQTVSLIQSIGNALVAGTLVPASDLHAVVVAAMTAAGTAVLRVLVPAITGLVRG